MGDLPQEPITSLREAAVMLHQLYVEYVMAGFTPEQALDLVKVTMTTRPPLPNE